MDKILITGGGGFIGRSLIKNLLSKKMKIRIFDIIKSSHNNELIENDYVGSILDPYELTKAVRGCDYVVHLAASLGVQNTETNRLQCLFINIQGIINVLEACAKENVKKIIFASSSEVYGEQNTTSISEEAPLNPKSNYAVSKLAGEEYVRAYAEAYGFEYNIIRFFNVYGINQRPDFVLPSFINNIKNNKNLNIFGDGKQVRSFCNVDDATNGIIKILLEAKNKETYNVGNDSEPISMIDLAKKVINISKKKLEINFIPYEKSDRNVNREIFKRIPNINKVINDIGYKPTVNLDDGIKKLLEE
tara:strand:+ start:1 stop:912 length:912 start_codon:yes stop_codon:yes gene_type:complete